MESRERPINLRAHEVRAILDGRQTQLRRLIGLRDFEPSHDNNPPYLWDFRDKRGVWNTYATADLIEAKSPFGQPGDRLWVREAHWVTKAFESRVIAYKEPEPGGFPPFGDHPTPWRSGAQMPREYSRILLEVVSVRMERLQGISRGDCMAEGCPFPNLAKETDPVGWYRDLWQKTNGSGSWEANPWVWVVEFRRMEA